MAGFTACRLSLLDGSIYGAIRVDAIARWQLAGEIATGVSLLLLPIRRAARRFLGAAPY